MEPLILGLQSQLNEIKGTLVELKAENAVLRNEILGISTSVNSNEQSMGILEKKALREFVEEIQFDIKSIQAEIKSGIHWKNIAVEQQPELSGPDTKDKEDADADVSLDEYPIMEIEHKTIEEERAWMKLKFNSERAKLTDPADGETLSGKTVESISSSIPISSKERSSCVLLISNHLNSDLADPQVFTRSGKNLGAPTNAITRHTREAFSFQGDVYFTNFLISFLISNDLRIAIECCSVWNCKVGLSVGVTPEGVPTVSLIHTMHQFTQMPDICSSGKCFGIGPLEYFIIHGKILARAQMSPGPDSVVHLEILEVGLPRTIRIPCTPNDLTGIFEITNCLTVSLKNPRKFVHKGQVDAALPMQVLPSSREIFFLSHTRVAEAIFSYEIDSTDLGLLIAFRIQRNKNAFSAAFVSLPAVTDKRNFDSVMDPGQWKSHLYRKYANAEDGEQEIQIRNIRARVSMTDEEKPQFKIRIFAV